MQYYMLLNYDFSLYYHPDKVNVVADALSRKSREVFSSIASREWKMLETVGQFGLHYQDQAQGVMDSLLATPSLLSRMVGTQGQDAEILSIRDRGSSQYGRRGLGHPCRLQSLVPGQSCGTSIRWLEEGDTQRVSLLSFCGSSQKHKDLLRSSPPVLLRWDEEAC